MRSALCAGFATAIGAAPIARAEDLAVPQSRAISSERFIQARLGPLDASLTLIDGRLLRTGRRHIQLELTNASQAQVAGDFRVLKTAAWQITPSTPFHFELDAGEKLIQEFQASLPMYVGPGLYDFAVRVAAGGHPLGSIRASLVKPIDWLVIGPFPPPEIGTQLAPERGVNLGADHDGLDGRVRWRAVPDFAFDREGRLELDLVFGPPVSPRCACAFTVFEAAQSEALDWRAEGADVVLLNGERLHTGDAAMLHKGRNSLLVRSCDRAGVWRLGVALLTDDGIWVGGLDNDLATLLDGFDALRRGIGGQGSANRQVLIEYVDPKAREVRVLGTFNGWVPVDLARSGAGVWTRDLLLPPGRYAYKLSVDGQLHPDPSAERREPDGFGGYNSVLIIR